MGMAYFVQWHRNCLSELSMKFIEVGFEFGQVRMRRG